MLAVETQALTKRYGRFTALQDLNLQVASGALFGFLGPNGAGKTTALRILLGLLRASAGAARVLGRDAWREGPALRAAVGCLPGDVRFWDTLTGRRTVAFVCAARGLAPQAGEVRRLVERFDLNLNKRVRDYSRGMKQKLGLILALLHRPRLLILDEPTNGLDPLVRDALFDELRAVAADGRTVLFSSHTLAEVETLCDWVAIVRGGALVEQERVERLRARALRRLEVRFRAGAVPPPPAALTVAEQTPGVLRGAWRGELAPLLAWLASAPVADVTLAPPDLEDLFRSYYGAPAAAAP